MTEQEYANQSLCFVCAFGEKVFKYSLKLSMGIWDEQCKEDIIITYELLQIFLNFDTREFEDWDGIYEDISEEDFEKLIIKIESLL